MGKATRWLRGLLGMKKGKENVSDNSNFNERKEKSRWSFARSEKDSGKLREIPAVDTAWLRSLIADSDKEQNRHAIAVAAASYAAADAAVAAAADAAVAAAQAAVAVVRLTSHGRAALFSGGRERFAAVKIQTVFRGFLARKARRALRGLVKLQALVRGYLVRKRAAATLHCMEALTRAQTFVQSRRARKIMSAEYKLQPEVRSRKSTVRTNSGPCLYVSEESPKIVEIDTGRPGSRSRRMSNDDHYYQAISSPLSHPISKNCILDHHYLQNSDWGFAQEECKFTAAQNTPRFGCSGMFEEGCKSTPRFGSVGQVLMPAKSMCGDSLLRPYSNVDPSYMAKTQSFKAKVRSQSAPRQRAPPVPFHDR